MELKLFFLASLLQCIVIEIVVHCSWEFKNKNKKFIPTGIKIIQVGSFILTPCLSLSHSYLKLISYQNSLKLTLSTSLSQAHSFTVAGLTHPQHRHHRNLTSPTHQPSQAADQPQTHATSVLWCGWIVGVGWVHWRHRAVVVARVGFMVVGVGVAWWAWWVWT